MSSVIAVLASDLHVWHKAPVFRSVEKCWWSAMRRQFDQVKELTHKYQCPFVVGGDIFDRATPNPETINFLMDVLPYPTYAIPGQHDLMHHSSEHIEKTGFWTLVKSGRVNTDLQLTRATNITIHNFGWGKELKPNKGKIPLDDSIHLAVIHRYLWTKSTGYVGASEETRLSAYKDVLKGYDAVLFGDNHHSVFYNLKKDKYGPSVFNPGSFFIRKSDEREHKPCVGLLYTDGTIKVHYLDCSQNKYLDAGEALQQLESREEMNRLMRELNDTGECGIDFVQAIQTHFRDNDVSPEVKQLILKAVEK